MPADDPPVTCLWERGSRPSPARTRGLFATALLTTLAAGCGECPTAANRGDLALAYIDFEQTLAENPPSPEQLPQLNRSFDNATIQLVSTDSQTVAALRALTPTLRPAYRPGPTHDRLTTLRVRITPQTARPDEVSPPEAQIAEVCAPLLWQSQPVDFTLRLRGLTGAALAVQDIQPVGLLPSSPSTSVPVTLPAEPTPLGGYVIELGTPDGIFAPVTRWWVTAEALNELRAVNQQRLLAVQAASQALKQALAAAQARNDLLSDQPADQPVAAFLSDPARLSRDLNDEIAALLDGRDPYAGKTGDYRRVMATDQGNVPIRVYAPTAVAHGQLLPLLVAFHGAGGDENMFFFGYGAGLIKQLAEESGILVATPRTEPFLLQPALFPALVEALALDYAIDPQRIYALGHSLGGVTAAQLARQFTDTLAGACCFSGGLNLAGASALPPTLIVAGELDPLNPPGWLRCVADTVRQSGLPVEYTLVEGYGHTLVVGARLREAVSWLLAHRR